MAVLGNAPPSVLVSASLTSVGSWRLSPDAGNGRCIGFIPFRRVSCGAGGGFKGAEKWVESESRVPRFQTMILQELSRPPMNGYRFAPEFENEESFQTAKKALEMAKVESDDIDLILMCSSTPDDLFGSGPQIQRALGCKHNPFAYDKTAPCSGFILGLVSAACHIRGGGFDNVLIIGTDSLSRYVDWTDRGTCILFGDAEGAVVMQACIAEDDRLFSFYLHSDGDGLRHLNAFINKNGADHAVGRNGLVRSFPPKRESYSCIHMNGQEVSNYWDGLKPLHHPIFFPFLYPTKSLNSGFI